jgi:hypothetical protein
VGAEVDWFGTREELDAEHELTLRSERDGLRRVE